MRRLRNQLRVPTDQDVPELCPVFIVFVDQKCDSGHGPDVSQTCESFWCNTFRFLVYRCVETLAIIRKTDWHDVWSTLRMQRREPRNPGLFQFCPNRAGNLRPLTRHAGNP